MGRSPCCDKVGLKKGPWTPEEDQKLLAYIEEHGHGSWRALPAKAGLHRCGKSCRLRWTNYLRPDIKRGKFNLQEEQTIIQLHALLGNRWSAIATHLPKRTDNEIKNYWNTHLKKRLSKMGIDPVTHKPKSDALSSMDGEQSKSDAHLSHIAQWESARLEAEARLVRESKIRSASFNGLSGLGLGMDPGQNLNKVARAPSVQQQQQQQPHCLDVVKAWQGGVWSRPTKCGGMGESSGGTGSGNLGLDLESPTSTLSFSENSISLPAVGFTDNLMSSIEFTDNSNTRERVIVKEECENENENENDVKGFGPNEAQEEMVFGIESPWTLEPSKLGTEPIPRMNFIDGFTDLLLANSNDKTSSDGSGESDNVNANSDGSDEFENKSYWNNILNLVNSSPPDSPVF